MHKYKTNLHIICQALVSAGAKVIWATSTPVDEIIHNTAKASRRYEADLQQYNQASIEIARTYNFIVNDMYGKMISTDLARSLLDDGIHFNTEANRVVGKFIGNSIESVLSA
ncbi:hypothetical protein ORQ98_14110 [Spartinivicinus sp. A2-2]|uniref:SGNH hydrolase-type esterase domain-containing protein n=1 Tax=Spartinivicinus poritis TaxID=2994640 RepID=A0ABT5U9P9_9GAMM|nr:SGNH/GDSL hydrolase family protein [Spartinivicinus sp. A2-2]MDE1463098.1 hypothetical protein [Spartinivicinus sp. A2-2]